MPLVFAVAVLLAVNPQTEASKRFDEGRAAIKAGDLETACKAFEQSYTLEPALGSLLNLASCLEKQGKLVASFVRYNDAIAWAQRTHEAEREAFARTHAQDLKARVSWLAISSADEVDAKVDGQVVHLGAIAISVPVELGRHELLVEKPGFDSFSQTITVTEAGTTYHKVPALKPTPVPVAAEPATAATPITPVDLTPPPPPPTVKVVTPPASSSAGGVALIVAGSIIGLGGGVGLVWSLTTYDTLQRQRQGVPGALVSVDDFNRLKWIYPSSWVAMSGGVALAVIGAIVLATSSHSTVTLVPTAGPGSGGMILSGSF